MLGFVGDAWRKYRFQRKKETSEKMPSSRLTSAHTQAGRLLPNRIELLQHLPADARVAEIGVADGDFSAAILKHARPKHLSLVDAWHTTRYVSGEDSVAQRFRSEISEGRVSLHKGLSLDVLATFPDDSFDWVYIDTDHSYGLTSRELALCERLVAPGGRICGHDFCTGNAMQGIRYGVVQAVSEFCLSRDWQYEYVTLESNGHFSFCLKRL